MLRTIIVGLFCCAAAATSAQELQLAVSIPARVHDLEPVTATVSLRNTGLAAIPVGDLPKSVRLEVVQLEDHGSGKCLIRRNAAHQGKGKETPLAPAAVKSAALDALAAYPFGLPQGKYQVRAEYVGATTTVAADPVSFVVIAPVATKMKAYESFLTVCKGIIKSSPTVGEDALTFVRRFGDFPYNAKVLAEARNRSAAATREEINLLLLSKFAESEEARGAARDLKHEDRRKEALASYEQYYAEMQRARQDPNQKVAAAAFEQLGTIQSPDDFQKYEAFLAQHGNSFFAPRVLQGMINAVDAGVLPPGVGGTKAEAASREYRDRLQTHYPRSFWAQSAVDR